MSMASDMRKREARHLLDEVTAAAAEASRCDRALKYVEELHGWAKSQIEDDINLRTKAGRSEAKRQSAVAERVGRRVPHQEWLRSQAVKRHRAALAAYRAFAGEPQQS